MNSDFRELLKILNAANVKYLIVGGYAVMEYAEPRYTKDLDIWISTDAANAHRVYLALREFGAPLTGITPQDFQTPELIYQIGRPPARVDVLMSVTGVEFEECWARRGGADYDGLPVNIISLADLIANKTATNRLQDLLDVENLRVAQEYSRKSETTSEDNE